MMKPKQLRMIARARSEYGGDLMTTRAGRRGARPISTRSSMHVVLRSTSAVGPQSFSRAQHNASVRKVIAKFAAKFGVRVLSLANAGNHVHLHVKLHHRFSYAPFIRAITGGIAMAVRNRSAVHSHFEKRASRRFWDRRPFTRIVVSWRGFLNVKDYVRLNEIEGGGFSRREAREMVDSEKVFRPPRRGH